MGGGKWERGVDFKSFEVSVGVGFKFYLFVHIRSHSSLKRFKQMISKN